MNTQPFIPRLILSSPWGLAVMIITLATVVRVVFFTGVFGSDEVTYTISALKILQGDWSPTNYIGATRYGVNLPIAFFMAVFGQSQMAAGLWSMLASIAEVFLVFHIANRMWGRRAAVYSALLLAFLPIHVHLAGRLLADAPLAFFITLSFVLFWHAEASGKRLLYVASGLAIGMVFWVKESLLIYSLVFALFPLVWRRFDRNWMLVVTAAVIPVLANFLFFKLISGNIFFLPEVIARATETSAAKVGKTSDILFYPKYLFIDLRHTWLLGPAFLAASIVSLRGSGSPISRVNQEFQGQVSFPWIWAIGLLFLLTFFPVSLSPLKTIYKQTNYMMVFMAPLCLIVGSFLAQQGRWTANTVMVASIVGGILLAGAQQQAIRTFVANSKATIEFAQENNDAILYVGTNALMVSSYLDITSPDVALAPDQLRPLDEAPAFMGEVSEGRYHRKFAILDYETSNVKAGAALVPKKTLDCWRYVSTLKPVGFGIGQSILNVLAQGSLLIPGDMGKKIFSYIRSYVTPQPAKLYQIMPKCHTSK